MAPTLNPKQQRFVELRAAGKSLGDAADGAGYNRSYGPHLIRKHHILAALKARQDRAAVVLGLRLGANPEMVLERLAEIAFSNIADCFDEKGHLKPIDNLPPAVQRAIASVRTRTTTDGATVTEIKMVNKLPALEKLGQHFKLFTEVQEVISSTEMIDRILDGRARAFARWRRLSHERTEGNA